MTQGAARSSVVGRRNQTAGPTTPIPARIRRQRDAARARAAGSLPALTSPLFGREAELAAIRWQLQRPDIRLLTLTGPPGVGKTSLAIAAACALTAAFAGEVSYVDISIIEEADGVLPAIAAALGATPAGDRPVLADLISAARERPRLIVLDGCEGVGGWSLAIGDVLTACPSLRVLAAGRAVLRSAWELEQPVLPLALPPAGAPADPATLLQSPAVALFVDRVRAVRPDFALTRDNGGTIAAICARLDGLPLALELAAVWARVLSPGAILARLDRPLTLLHHPAPDRPRRHQSLRAAIAWSDGLLAPAERRFFHRLAVCAGSFSFATAEAVGNPREELGRSTFDLLIALVDYNLLQFRISVTGESRFRFLEIIRAYAWERLASNPAQLETALRRWGARGPADARIEAGVDGPREDGPLDRPLSEAPESSASEGLTAREREVATLVGCGLTSRQIADRLVISKRTVDTHVDHIRAKLGLRSRAQVAAWVAARGLVAGGDPEAGPP